MNVKYSTRMGMLPEYIFGKLNATKMERRRAGVDIIDLGMGNPNDPPPQPVIDKLIEAVQDPRNHRYSVAADGIRSLKREVARFYKRDYGVDLDPESEVVATIGSKEGLSHLSLVLVEPGDTAIVPTPAFPAHIYSIVLAGGQVVDVPLDTSPEFFDRLDDLVPTLPSKPKLLVLNFPHNPTAATVELDYFRRALAFGRRHEIIIVHDMAYGGITFDGYRAPSFLQAEGAKEVGAEFSSMSKSFNMAGWRVGFCVGNSQVVGGLARIKGYYDYGIFMPVQIASIIALRDCARDTMHQAAIYQARRDALCDGLGRGGWHVERPKGTMFVWGRIPEEFRHMGSVNFCFKLLEEANVAVAPGAAFGKAGDEYVRMAIVENKNRLQQAARQIGRALKERVKV
jgi:alanine-synthesizing transaminase